MDRQEQARAAPAAAEDQAGPMGRRPRRAPRSAPEYQAGAIILPDSLADSRTAEFLEEISEIDLKGLAKRIGSGCGSPG